MTTYATTNSTRVREIIAFLNYDQLVDDGVIPNNLFSLSIPKAKYPPIVNGRGKKRNYTSFGMFLDELSQEMCTPSNRDWKEKVYPLYSRNCVNEDMTEKELYKFMGFFVNMHKFLKEKLVPFLDDTPPFCQEMKYDTLIEGHPDVLTNEHILDFKTTGDFEKMRKGTILQLLAYHALSVCLGKPRNTIGVVLLLQRKIITETLDVSYDPFPFMQILIKAVKRVTDNHISFIILNTAMMVGNIGQHMAKPEFLKYLKTPSSLRGRTIQIFTRSPRGNGDEQPITDQEIDNIAHIVKDYGIRLYIHAPYWINLSHRLEGGDAVHPLTTKDRPSAIDVLKQELEIGNRLGAHGVVVHVGKALSSSIEDATATMKKNILKCLKVATEQCPLLLETAAGAGTELCWKMKDLVKFYQSISLESSHTFKSSHTFGLCFDTAHVHASDYDPYAAISVVWKHHPQSIKLIHFNGSRVEKGSRVDAHSYFDDKLRAERLVLVYAFAMEKNIPMVRE